MYYFHDYFQNVLYTYIQSSSLRTIAYVKMKVFTLVIFKMHNAHMLQKYEFSLF